MLLILVKAVDSMLKLLRAEIYYVLQNVPLPRLVPHEHNLAALNTSFDSHLDHLIY